ncbi:hypothetical protein [Hyalangium rubrum]|uniref:ATP-binding protein n=1 Tax=Hyalangium rubrum TaxID=3103134 RepID=A0ABU5H0H5_9BACT|nr:hypothetical protein [Hyalangium sp. s54d21]MDY7226629.1 hypothetical protein [Hyalangium sp. s54d21]
MPTNDGIAQERKSAESSVVRPEARPLYWADLTEDQRKVVVEIHQWLEDFIKSPLDKGLRTGMTRSPFDYQEIHEHRPSNVILIDGGRGSGKTSVLLTALRLWRRAAAGDGAQLRSDLFGPSVLEGGGSTARNEEHGAPLELIARLQGPLARKLVPIRPLDLQPLPPSTSLLPWIAGRLLELVDHLEDPSGGREIRENTAPIASWEPEWEKELASRRQWRNLLQCAALGWASNLPARQGSLDPDSYAEELKQAERARLTVFDQWRYFLDAVIADAHRLYPHLVDENARLIIPIDDADMNPHRCVDLLELMRSLWAPRVFFILTGHSPLFQKTLHLHYLKMMRQPLGNGALTDREFDYVEAKPNARQLGLQAYDKVIPAGHRFKLAKLSGTERFLLLKDMLTVSIQKEGDEDFAPPTLAGYFELSPALQQGLPHRLRQIQNVRQRLERDPHAMMRISRLWTDTIENGQWTTDEQALLKQLVQVNQDGELRVDVEQKLEPLARRINRLKPSEKLSLNVNIITGFTFKGPIVERSPQTGEQRSQLRELEDYLTSLLMLAMNVAADIVSGSFPRTAPAPRHIDYPLVVSHLQPLGKLSSQLAFTWPIPEWAAPIDFSVFDKAWARHLLRLKEDKAAANVWYGEMVYLYLWGIVEVGLRRTLPDVPVLTSQEAPRESSSWGPLIQRIVREAARLHTSENKTLRTLGFYNWLLGEAILLAAPEYGLPEELANSLLLQWLAALKTQDKWFREQALDAARHARRAKVRYAIREAKGKGGGEESILAEIDNAHDRFVWGRAIEDRAEPVIGLPTEIKDLLEKVIVQHPPASSIQTPPTLQEYLAELHVKPLLSLSDPQRLKELQDRLERYVLIEGAAPLVLRLLWRFFVVNPAPESQRRSLDQMIVEKKNRLKLHLPENMRQWLTEPVTQRARPEKEVAARAEADSTPGLAYALRIFPLGDGFEKPASALEGLLQVAHDVQFDEDDGRGSLEDLLPPSISPSKAVLPRATTVLRQASRSFEFDWLVPGWGTFLDWKETNQIWTLMFKRIDPLLQETGSSLSEVALVALFHAFLDGMRKLCLTRNVDPQSPNLNIGSEELALLGKRIREVTFSSKVGGARFLRAVEWAQGAAALYGAPESGMPVWAAEAYLSAWKDASPGRVAEILEVRRSRAKVALVRAGISADTRTVKRFLNEIDQAAGGHPWFKIFANETHGQS